ncbi:MAG: hypothetical protein P1V97_24655 [Planctomycetota bacterium]|nr:hypothetical protein [Planctomycetota bacterium]
MRERPANHVILTKLVLPPVILATALFVINAAAHGQSDYESDAPATSHRKIGESKGSDISSLQNSLLKNFQNMDPKERDKFLSAFQGKDPQSMKDPESFDPKQREALQKMMRKLMKNQDDGKPNGGTESGDNPDADPDKESMPPHIREMLEGLQQPKPDKTGSPLEELMEDPDLQSFVRDFTKGLNSETRDGESAFPWLNDPQFPQDLMKMRGQKSFFDKFTKGIAKSGRLNTLLKEGLKWRRKNNERSRGSSRTSRGSSTGPNGQPTSTPNSQGSQSPTVLQRISKLSPSQASGQGGMGWSLPRLPLFFSFSSPNMSNRSVPSFDVGRPSAPSFDPTIFFFVLFGLFLVAVVGLVFGSRLQNRVGHWIEQGQGRLRPRRGWPTPPEQMASNHELVANVLHLNSKLYPHRLWNHTQLRSELHRANPEAHAEIETLSRDFERAYYRQAERDIQRSKLAEHARILRKLGADQTPSN